MDVLAEAAHPLVQLLGGQFHRGLVRRVVGRQQCGVGVLGELRVNGQPHRAVAVARQLDRELHPLGAARHGGHVLGVLPGGQQLLQNGPQLHFAQNAPGLDVAQHLFQIAHARGQRAHLAQPFVHQLQLLAHKAETLLQPVLQRFLQLFVHRLAHLAQPTVGHCLHGVQAHLHGGADALQLLLGLHVAGLQPGGHAAGKFLPRLAYLGQQVLPHLFQVLAGKPPRAAQQIGEAQHAGQPRQNQSHNFHHFLLAKGDNLPPDFIAISIRGLPGQINIAEGGEMIWETL